MRADYLLWLIWFCWAAVLLNSVFPDAGVIIGSELLLAGTALALTVFYFFRRKGSMKIFNSKPKSSAALQNVAEAIEGHAAGSAPQAEARSKVLSISCKRTLISSDMVLNGDLKGGGNIVIEGLVEGNIDNQLQVCIEKTGQVKGDIRAQHIFVNGRAEGKLYAEAITLQGEGVIEGAIFVDELVIEKGGVFIGQAHKKTASGVDERQKKTALTAVPASGAKKMSDALLSK